MKTLREAAQAVCDRWDTPNWKDVEPTAVFIGELREAIKREEDQSVKPVYLVDVGGYWCETNQSQYDKNSETNRWMLFTHPSPASTVTCQIYGHVVGACGECNTHEEADVNVTNAKLASNYLELVAKVQELETELARVKAKWQDDYLTLNDVCNQQIELKAAAKLALDALEHCQVLVADGSQHKWVMHHNAAIEALKKAGIK